MGRTYKRNDLHNSRRPKSIREKRQFGSNKKYQEFDDYSAPDKQQRNRQFDAQDLEDYRWTMY